MLRSHTRPLLAVLGALILVLGACGGEDEASGSSATAADVASDAGAAVESAAGVRVVPPQTAADLLADDPSITVVDVRTPAEFAEAHLDDAVLIDIQSPDFEQRIGELDRDGSYVLYCRSGNRSAQARQVMADLGFRDVADIGGGILAWVDAGLPVA